MGGPTPQGFEILDAVELPQRNAVSNIKNGIFFYHNNSWGLVDSVDLRVDIAALPVADSSLGMLLASCIPEADKEYGDGLRASLVEEASRVLEPGGLLCMQGARWTDMLYAQRHGLDPVKLIENDQDKEFRSVSFIARQTNN